MGWARNSRHSAARRQIPRTVRNPETPRGPGGSDALRNCPWAIEHFLDGLGIRGETTVKINGLEEPLEVALASRQLPEHRAHLVGLHAQALVDAMVPLAMREYSIASIAADGVLELIVRQEQHSDGSLGIGSGWLTEHAQIGAASACGSAATAVSICRALRCQ